MGANVTIYCLEQLTDYIEFERLCSDLMSKEGYTSIEPLGNFKDKGRDAIHVDKADSKVTIFAYSVREDWQAKLSEDADKIRKHNHTCHQLVFLTTAKYAAGDRDRAIKHIKNEYGWNLELYGLERLRILLEVDYPQIRKLHPQIFPSSILQLETQNEVLNERRHILILADKSDRVFAEWLARRLASEQFLVWYEYTENLSGEMFPDDIEVAIEHSAVRVIAVISKQALQNPDLVRLRAKALSMSPQIASDFLIPVLVENIDLKNIDSKTRELRSVAFVNNWATGLRDLFELLTAAQCPKILVEGPMLAAQSYFDRNNLTDDSENVVSNCLLVEKIPEQILLFRFSQKVPWETHKRWKRIWSFNSIDPRHFLSFQHPPEDIRSSHAPELVEIFKWRQNPEIKGKDSFDLVTELLNKALDVHCESVGLTYLGRDRGYCFQDGLVKNNRVNFVRPNGKKSHVQVIGKRKKYRPNNKSFYYKHYLSPGFRVRRDLFSEFVVLLDVRVQFSKPSGERFDTSMHPMLRKHLTKNWWNHEWVSRMLALASFLGKDGIMTIGENDEQIVVSSKPLIFTSPYGIKSEDKQ